MVPISSAGHCRLVISAIAALLSARAFSQPLLGFPIRNQNPYTAPITTVVDHSASNFYSPFHIGVLAYTGELALGKRGAVPPYGYFLRSTTESDTVRFMVNGDYVGTTTNGSMVLNYSGHAGFDYRYPAGTEIIAPADGVMYIPASDEIYIRFGDPWCSLHAFYIDHGSGWTTWYLHADHVILNNGRLADGGLPHACERGIHTTIDHDERLGVVKRGEPVAIVGDFGHGFAGGVGYHLHFEVRRDCVINTGNSPRIHGCRVVDPYGWESDTQDPFASHEPGAPHNHLAASQSIPLWDLAALGTMLPTVDGVSLIRCFNGYRLDITGHNFAPGASITLWRNQGGQFVVALNPVQVTDTHIQSSFPDRLAKERASLTVKVQNPKGPRSKARMIGKRSIF